jgi:hypothetical protein
MPILLVAGVVLAAWMAIWKSGSPLSKSPPSVQDLGRRLGKATKAAADSWEQSSKTRLSLADARALLGVGEGATPAEIEAAYRRLMLRAHPDHGGSKGLAAQLTAARDRLIKRS